MTLMVMKMMMMMIMAMTRTLAVTWKTISISFHVMMTRGVMATTQFQAPRHIL